MEMSLLPLVAVSHKEIIDSQINTRSLDMLVFPFSILSNEEIYEICGNIMPEEAMDLHEMPVTEIMDSQSNTKPLDMSDFPFSTLTNDDISKLHGKTMHHEQIRHMNMKISKLNQKQNSVLRDQAVKAILYSALQLQEEKDLCIKKESELKQKNVDLEKKCDVQQKTIQRNINIDKQERDTTKSKMDDLTEEITKLLKNNQANETEISELKTHNSLLQCFSELHFHNFSKVSEEKNNLQNEYDNLLEKVKNLEKKFQRETEQLDQLKNITTNKEKIFKQDSEKCKTEIKDLNVKLLEANDKIKNFQKETEQLEQLKKVKQDSEKYKTEIENLNTKLLEANTIIEKYQEQEITRVFEEGGQVHLVRKFLYTSCGTLYISTTAEPTMLPQNYNGLQYGNHQEYYLRHGIKHLNQKCQILQKQLFEKSWKNVEQNQKKDEEISYLRNKITEFEQTCGFKLQKEINDLKTKCKKHEQTISRKSNEILQQRKTHGSEVEKLRREIDYFQQKYQEK